MLSIKSPLCLSATGALPAEEWPAGGGSAWSRCNSSEMQIQIGQIHTKYKLYKYKFKLKYKDKYEWKYKLYKYKYSASFSISWSCCSSFQL